MTEPRGFGKPKPQPKISEGAKQRAAAAEKFDGMKDDGSPEYEIYMRLKGNKNWVPVGKIAVKRSNMINYALYDNEAALLEGAYRMFPYLRKQQGNLEYGYRLKEFKDDEIELAERPKGPTPSMVTGALADATQNITQKISGLFKRKS